jgi:magnesium chelatase family protein
MLARVSTFAIDGVDPRHVCVEVDIRSGLPSFTIVGLGDTAVRESRDRIRAAILNSGFKFPDKRITANLAPAFLRKVGPGFDAAIALAILAASGQIPAGALESCAVFGELSLGGELRDSPGVLAVAEGAQGAGLESLIVPRERAREAALIGGLRVAGVDSLQMAADVVTGRLAPDEHGSSSDGAGPSAGRRAAAEPDLADVRGQATALLALEIAAAGAHNLLLEGAPGTGKTLLARRVPSILPAMTREEAIEVTRIHSVAGIHADGLITARPFRAPHHTITSVGLVGGGSPPRPGEATLANHGVLFLDELSEFQRTTLEALRQPLEDGVVTIVRAQHALRFPTRFMLIAATNPCPCGYAGVDDRCMCGELEVRRYQRRLSGPLLDRMDLLVAVKRPTEHELRGHALTDSASTRARVGEARQRQQRRLEGTGFACNGEMDARSVRRSVRLEPDAADALGRAYAVGALSPRGRHRVMRVARTIADLEGHDQVTQADVLSALSLRQRAGGETALAA